MTRTMVSGHWRTIHLRNGQEIKFFVKEHVRDDMNPKRRHRLSGEMAIPVWQHEMLERMRSQTEEATNPYEPSDQPTPQELGAQSYMEHQRKMLRKFRRREL